MEKNKNNENEISTPKKGQKELNRIEKKLGDFDWLNSEEKSYFDVHFSYCTCKHTILLSLAIILSNQIGSKLTRDEKRSKRALLKWYHDRWTTVLPYLNGTYILDDKKRVINFS